MIAVPHGSVVVINVSAPLVNARAKHSMRCAEGMVGRGGDLSGKREDDVKSSGLVVEKALDP
jgi:hypothetical protein